MYIYIYIHMYTMCIYIYIYIYTYTHLFILYETHVAYRARHVTCNHTAGATMIEVPAGTRETLYRQQTERLTSSASHFEVKLYVAARSSCPRTPRAGFKPGFHKSTFHGRPPPLAAVRRSPIGSLASSCATSSAPKPAGSSRRSPVSGAAAQP